MSNFDNFTEQADPILLVGDNKKDGFLVEICREISYDELADVICEIIKMAISTMPDAVNINEQAEMQLFQLIEQRIIEDEASYLNPEE